MDALKQPLRVGLDLDGVCYDFVDSLRRYLVSTGRRVEDLPDALSWEFYTSWGLDLPQFLASCHAGVDAGVVFRTGAPYAGVPAAASRLLAAGCEVHVVTDRSFGASKEVSQEATRAWLSEHAVPYTSLTFSADKTVVPVDVFVEDRLENYDALAAAGVRVYLVDRPWNRDDGSRRRVRDLAHFVDEVLALQFA